MVVINAHFSHGNAASLDWLAPDIHDPVGAIHGKPGY